MKTNNDEEYESDDLPEDVLREMEKLFTKQWGK